VEVGDKKFLVTGATGFIGQRVVRILSAAGATVETLRMRDADVAAVTAAARASHADRVIHLAGFTDIGASWLRPAECVIANVSATAALLDGLKDTQCERFVYASTADVYGDAPAPFVEDGPIRPRSPYAVSKFAAEQLTLLGERVGWPPAVVVRPFNAYGPGQPANRVVPDVILHALRGDDVEMSSGKQEREFNHVDDIAEGIVAAATVAGVEGMAINLGSGEPVSIRWLAETILRLMGDPVTPRFGALPDRPLEVPVVAADTTLARRVLGWSTRRTLDDGLRETIDWYRTHDTAGS
jgi:nucleoside-diphosphate-sugar epimerase